MYICRRHCFRLIYIALYWSTIYFGKYQFSIALLFCDDFVRMSTVMEFSFVSLSSLSNCIKHLYFLSLYVRFTHLHYANVGWVRGANPGGGEIFRTCPDRPWGSPSLLLYNGYRVFPGGKAAGAWR
jgi:hypothetical protein